MFIADQPCCRDFLAWQREAIEDQASALSPYFDL
jgi:hypothetical protein